jgi:hypothetical protein
MKITTTEANRLKPLATDLQTKAQAFIDAASTPNVAPFEMGATINNLIAAMNLMRDAIPTDAASGTSAAGTTVAGPAAYRAKVQAGQDS